MTTYKLDAGKAKEADQRGGNWIKEPGAYTGTFTRAEKIVAASGTEGVSFSFEADDGQKCDISLYTIRTDGTTTYGHKQLMALMTCLSLREISETEGKVDKWDRDSQKNKTVEASIYPDLMNKPIGIFLESEEFQRNDGGVGISMRVAAFFRAADQFMAGEILNKATTASSYDKVLATLKHKPLPKLAQRSAGKEPPAFESPEYTDEDIPF